MAYIAAALFLCGCFFAYAADVEIDARVPGCGDGVAEGGEECDGTDFDGKTCFSQGFNGGSLACTPLCILDTAACTTGGGGGGGSGGAGGAGGTRNSASVVLVGRAYPGSTVSILKDGVLVAETVASSLANFQVSIRYLASGSYQFGVYSEDKHKVRSRMLSYPVVLSRGVVTKIDGIFIAPSLSTDKEQVRRGDPIVFFGQTVPTSQVTLEVNSPQQFFASLTSDTKGVYLHNFDTSPLVFGDHHTTAHAATSTEISPKSTSVPFIVGSENVFVAHGGNCPKKADLNSDCRVNLVDFSIAAFWHKRTLSDAFMVREKEKLSGDGVVNIIDFSMMAFYWTG